MPDFTTYNYIGNSSAPVRLGAVSPRPWRVVESGYVASPSEDDFLAPSCASQFGFCLPPSGRVVEFGFVSALVDDRLFNLSPSEQRAFGRAPGGRVVESVYDAYDPSVQNGGVPDPIDSPSTVETSDWGSLASSTVEDDWGTLDAADNTLDYGTIA